jgi:N-acetylglucosamine-6-phosphate deacetylase
MPLDPLLITNARICAANETIELGWLLASAGRIAALGIGEAPAGLHEHARAIDAAGAYLLPGFIDIHVHGSVGHDTMDEDDGAALLGMARFFATRGVTGFLATTWTAAPVPTMSALRRIAQHRGRIDGGATLLGAHLEGPFLCAEFRGAQDPALIRRASREEALPYLDHGVIKLLSFAPEYAENEWLFDACAKRGITLSAAHTGASYAQLRAAVARGLRGMTHTFNAMRGLHHREPGAVGAALVSPELYCEVIADGVHVHPGALDVLWRGKGTSRVVLITDAVRAAGMPDGDYPIDANRTVTVKQGSARLPDGTLAGSVLTMDRAFAVMLGATGLTVDAAWPMTSLNAARAIGIDGAKGSIAIGKDADLVIMSRDMRIQQTIVGGEPVNPAS